ncbi:MAG: crotonase/enoyl-CoA hydratase family protein [Acidimicrobiales bacterium]
MLHHHQLEVDDSLNALTLWMRPPGRTCFTSEMLEEISLVTTLCQSGRFGPIDYWVLGSRVPGVFSYGGDLELFSTAIRARDRRVLQGYGRICVDLITRIRSGLGLPLTTVGLVQGDALGGGAEAALACQVVVAEEGYRIGFPEIHFNLFSPAGVYQMLTDRIGVDATHDLLVAGELHTTDQFHELGLIHVLAERGKGIETARDTMEQMRSRANGRLGLAAARSTVSAVRYDALVESMERWADRAIALPEADLATIEALIDLQQAKICVTAAQ